MKKSILVVGAGFSGSVIAREVAESGYYTIVLEERNHPAGLCHTVKDSSTGVMVHVYGPHVFHTDNETVWNYVNRFAIFKTFINRVKTTVKGQVYSLPINLHTINQFFGKNFSPKEAADYIRSLSINTGHDTENLEEQALYLMGRDLYESFFKGYSIKQWGRDPKDLPASILQRLPFRFNYDDNYYNSRFQGIPESGYTSLIERILDHQNIVVYYNTPWQYSLRNGFSHVFYTGAIDRFFDFCQGRLQYRTLDFETFYPEDTLGGDFQGCAVMNYADLEVPWTRITEHKHFAFWEQHERTLCYREFSRNSEEEDIVYYPMQFSGSCPILDKYRYEVSRIKDVTFLGRLANYQYLDMDVAIKNSLIIAKSFIRMQ